MEVLQRNTGTGDLTLDQALSEGAGGIAGLDGVSDIVVAPDGRHVYTSASVENAIAVFDRDALTGRLVQTAVVRDGLNGVSGLAQARSLVISPDGANVYAVASGTTSAVTAFSRNATTGALTFLQRITDADGPPRYTPATGAPAPAQRRALMLSGFTISKRKFARGAKGVSLRFVLSEPATATITLNREQAGKRRGSRCVPPTRKLRKAKNCTRRVRVRTLKVAAKAGRNTVALATKSLLPAKYVAHIRARVATDGRTSSLATLRFTVTKPKPKRART